MKKEEIIRTFETRVFLDELGLSILDEMAKIYANVMHALFAQFRAGKNFSELKSGFLKSYEITGRQFNAIHTQLDGKIDSIKARVPLIIEAKKEKIARLEEKMPRHKKKPELFHQKQRSLARLKQELKSLENDQANGIIKLCFGSKKLWRAQFNLEENGYVNQEEWLQDWQDARAKELFFLGSHEEMQGNQTCSAFLQENGTIALRIRLSNALAEKHGKYLWIHGVRFNHGEKEVLKALEAHKLKKGKALSFRLLKDAKGWRVFISLSITPPEIISQVNSGVVGVDINVDNLSLAETDRFGNLVDRKIIRFNLKHKRSDQVEAILGDVCAEAVAFADNVKKPLVLEKLDFSKKKASLKEKSVGYARMLSSFAYAKILYYLQSRALKQGIQIAEINPTFTSLIGRVCFAYRYGITIHESAALIIGRRFLGTSEKPPFGQRKIPTGKGSHVTLELPVRTVSGHVWGHWKKVSKKVSAALRAHFLAAKKSRSSNRCKPAPETETPKDASANLAGESSGSCSPDVSIKVYAFA
jgi:IS605 OrfB family transposase